MNTAARLQGHADTGGILISSETYALVRDAIQAQEVGLLTLKGLSRPARAYKVLGIYEDMEAAGDLIRIDHPGLQMLFNPSSLADDLRQDARNSLLEALRRLDTE